MDKVRLVAQWSIKSKDKTLLNKRSRFTAAEASTTDIDKMVEAQSECLTKLGQEIAVNLKPLTKVINSFGTGSHLKNIIRTRLMFKKRS